MVKVGAGRPTTLTLAEEKEVVYSCQVLQELGYGLTRVFVTEIVAHYLKQQDKQSTFNNGCPGADWWEGFLGRWPSLTERKPQHLSSKRASAANPDTLGAWFTKVKAFFKKVGLLKRHRAVADLASRIWNADETGFCLGSTCKKVLARRGSRCVNDVGGASDHQYITVNTCGNAEGIRLPPFILYKGKHLYNTWTEGGLAGACYGVSSSGWMEEVNYLKWFELQFYPAVKHLLSSGPVVLVFDGHFSHMGIDLILTAREKQIHLLCLPPNCTHVLQPLDVGVFGPVKECWRSILKLHQIKTRARNVTKERFPGLIKQLWERSITSEHLKAGFGAAGLVPLDASVIQPSQLSPSSTTVCDSPEPVDREFANALTTVKVNETPLRTELREYFRKALMPSEKPPRQQRRRVELSCAGEVLTSDEVTERIQNADREREKAKKTKKKRKDEDKQPKPTSEAETDQDDVVACESCGQAYSEDEAESWIGCDVCESWWHFWCAGLQSMLTEDDEWLCENCLPEK